MKPPFRSLRSPALRRLLFTGIQLGSLAFASGCAASAPRGAMAPPSPPADVAPAAAAQAPAPQPAPPSTPPAQASRGYAPPSAPPGASREAADEVMPAAYQQPAPTAAPPPAPRAPAAKGAPTKAPPPPPKLPPPPKAPPPPAKGAPAAHAAPAAPVTPMLIYVGDYQMAVDEAELALTLDKVIDIAESLGGYLAGRKDTSVQVRIPSARFRESLLRLEKLGDVLHRTVTADDVSEQYSDLEGRLLNLRATRQRLQEFLARSGTMADMLQVGRELERVAAEIEQIEGKMRFLRSRASFSLVTVAVQARPKQIVKIADTPPPPPPPRDVELPIEWLTRVGLDRLLNLRSR